MTPVSMSYQNTLIGHLVVRWFVFLTKGNVLFNSGSSNYHQIFSIRSDCKAITQSEKGRQQGQVKLEGLEI